MRYSADHKAETRRRLIKTAGALAKKNGFATTGVDGLMASVNLTGGAFYSHFSSKDDLLNEIVAKELNTSRERILHVLEKESSVEGLQNFSAHYLSAFHVHHPEQGCALTSLSNEIARADHSIKQTYQDSVQAIQKVLADTLHDDTTAWAALALNVGAVVMARAMDTPEAQQQLLDACRQFANNLLKPVDQTQLSA